MTWKDGCGSIGGREKPSSLDMVRSSRSRRQLDPAIPPPPPNPAYGRARQLFSSDYAAGSGRDPGDRDLVPLGQKRLNARDALLKAGEIGDESVLRPV